MAGERVKEEGEGHDHSAFERGCPGDGVDSFAGREVEDVDLLDGQILEKGRERLRTVSELMVFGTAIKSSSEPSSFDGRSVWAKEQKFIVLTSKM
jgi:hypothetical protein